MSGLRTSINLIDNFSNRMRRINEVNDQTLITLERLEQEYTNHEKKLETVGEYYRLQENKAQKLRASYEREVEAVRSLQQQQELFKKLNVSDGIEAKIGKSNLEQKIKEMERYKEEMLKAQMAAIRLGESFDKGLISQEKQRQQIEKIKSGIDNAETSQENFKNQLERSISPADKLLNRIKSFATAYLSFKVITKAIKETIGAAAELRKQSAVLEAAFGNENVGKGYFKHLQNYAIETEHNIGDLISVTRDFMGMTKNTNKLRGLTDLTNRLSIRTGNLNSAGSMMQEAMSGRFGNLQRTLHLTNSQLEPLKQSIKRGSLEGIIEAFDSAFKTAGLTDDIVAAYQNTPLDKFEDIIARTKLRLAEVGQGALLSLDPVLSTINTWLQSDNATMFFNTMAFGLDLVVQGFAFLFDKIPLVTDAISQGFGFAGEVAQSLGITLMGLSPMILGVAAAWAIYNGALLVLQARTLAVATAKKIAAAATNLFSLALKMNPIGLVIAAIIGLAVAMDSMGKVTQGIRKVFSDAFGFIVDVAQGAMNSVIGIINGAIRGLNKVSGFFANLLGVDAKQIQEIEFKADFQRFKEKGQNFIETVTFDDIKGKLGWDKFTDPTTDAIDGFAEQESRWNAAQQDTLGSIDDTGKKIKEGVDKSEEDLKWMRDIAEQEVVNRFTTATLAPQISAYFGDVRETADIDGIITRIEEKLMESIAIAAEGV